MSRASLIRYVYHSRTDRIVDVAGDAVIDLSTELLTDAYFAGGSISQIFTGAVRLVIRGPHNIFAIQGLSTNHDAVAFSMPETALYAR